MTAQQLLLTASPAIPLSDSSSNGSDEVEIADLLARISDLAALLLTDVNPGDLTPTKRVELTIKLFSLEYRVLVQRNQARKLALQQETLTKQPARRRSHSISQRLAETEETNDPVQSAEQFEASAFSDPVLPAPSFALEQASTNNETNESSYDAAERLLATETSPIDANSYDIEGEHTAVSEVTESEQTLHLLPSLPSDTDLFTEAVSQEDAILESQDGAQTQKTKMLVIEKKAMAKPKGMNKKKPSGAGKKTFSHSRPVKPKKRKR